MGIKPKFWFYRNYWWLLIILFVLACLGLFHFSNNLDITLIATLTGTFLSLVFFIQKQRVEEIRLFREIFTECNARYDKMNDGLNAIVAGCEDNPLSPAERNLLYDYFNLCGEEYLYYIQGFIFPSVWKAWLNGMKFFIKNKRIAEVWKEEEKTDSYYGLRIS
ncbi:MAG TPA: hypothetical protein PLA03_09910 [Acidobacteriota bacterium]|nr:hypothetical protein [Acidobacteriota bacterium]